jgi:hypothetical protein
MDKDHLDRIVQAITENFEVKNLKHGLLRLSHGAQLSNAGSVFGFFLTLFLLIIPAVEIVQGSYVASVYILPLCVLIVAYILDYRGVEIDTQKGKVRSYKSFLGFRSGEWFNTDYFNQLRICQDSILEGRTLGGGSTYSSSRSFDTHKFYTLYLVDGNERHFIKLHEEESVTRVRILGSRVSERSRIPLNQNIVRKKSEVIGGL